MLNLTFHGIGDPGRAMEPAEQSVWISIARFRSILDQVVGRDDVCLTFDDGNASDIAIALPELLRRDLRGSFFILGGKLGQPGYVDSRGVRELSHSGMCIGTHGMHHRDWRTLDSEQLRAEISESQGILREITGGAIEVAACPFGSYDRRVLRALRRAGFHRVYTSDRGWARADSWLQPRNSVRETDILPWADPRLNRSVLSVPGLLRELRRLYKRWR